jgi:predicted tellurium resistance membrane protein TerC
MSELFTTSNLISLITLSAMEIVLGIDNIVFIAILSQKVAEKDRSRVRRIGLVLALATRLGLLATLSFIMKLTAPLFTLFGQDFSGRSLVLLGGGLFLLAKSTHEIYEKLEGEHQDEAAAAKGRSSIPSILMQIMILDVVFSLDSVITAVGMAQDLWIMVTAMLISVAVMLIFANSVSEFINRHPSMKVLALSFLLLIGVLLVAEGLGQHVNKGYIYFAMAFSLVVELFNMRLRKRRVHPPA